MTSSILVTGGSGCLGAWVVRQLLASGCHPIVFHRGEDNHRLNFILSEEEHDQVVFAVGDVTDPASITRAIDDHEVDGVVHLAALQIPFCAADPALGAAVNVVGTVNMFEAFKRRRDQIRILIYASSNALFDESDASDGNEVPENADGHPRTHYGVYKLANEGTARTYWHQDGLPSIGIRPWALFGVGRDQGLTSSPTKAMLAAALNTPYEISFSSALQLQFVPDVAQAFVKALEVDIGGAPVYNVGGPVVSMREVVSAIEDVVPSVAGQISIADRRLPFPAAFSSSIRQALYLPPPTPLVEAVRETVEAFHRLSSVGAIGPGALA